MMRDALAAALAFLIVISVLLGILVANEIEGYFEGLRSLLAQ